jgi:hypothetical protein
MFFPLNNIVKIKIIIIIEFIKAATTTRHLPPQKRVEKCTVWQPMIEKTQA